MSKAKSGKKNNMEYIGKNHVGIYVRIPLGIGKYLKKNVWKNYSNKTWEIFKRFNMNKFMKKLLMQCMQDLLWRNPI